MTRPAVRALFWALLLAGFAGGAAAVVWVAVPNEAADGGADTFVVDPDRIPSQGGRPIFLAPHEIWLVHLAAAGDDQDSTGPGLLAFDARVPHSGTLALWSETAWLLPEAQGCLDDPSCSTLIDPAAPGYFFDVHSRFSAAGQRLFGPSPDDLARHRIRVTASGTVEIKRAVAAAARIAPLPYDGPTASRMPRRLFLLSDREASPYPLPDLLAAGFLVRMNPHNLDGVDPTTFAAVVVDVSVFDRPSVTALVHAVAQTGAVVAAIDVAMIDLAHVATEGTTDFAADPSATRGARRSARHTWPRASKWRDVLGLATSPDRRSRSSSARSSAGKTAAGSGAR